MKNCLFCDSNDLHLRYAYNSITSDRYSISCSCGAFGKYKETKEEAEKTWNTELVMKFEEGIRKR